MGHYHKAEVFYNLESYLKSHIGDLSEVPNWSKKTYEQLVKFWTIRWNRATKNGKNLPFVSQCPICSGEEMKHMRKTEAWKESTQEEQKLKVKIKSGKLND